MLWVCTRVRFTCVCVHRDASFGNCTFNLTVLDCLQGIRKVSWKWAGLVSLLAAGLLEDR